MTTPTVLTQARARRLLVVRPGKKGGLGPIYAALLLLVGLSLLGFAASFLPQDPGPSASRASYSETPHATRSVDDGVRTPTQPDVSRTRGRWM